MFLNDKVKFKNFEYEEDYDTASLPDSDFNTINMLNDLFKITKPVGFAESQKLRFDEESPTTNTLEDENGLEATTYETETESLPTNVAVEAENHDPEVKETTTTKTFTELAALIFEDPTTTSSTEFVEERESEILTISSFDLSTGTPMPEINTEENIVDTFYWEQSPQEKVPLLFKPEQNQAQEIVPAPLSEADDKESVLKWYGKDLSKKDAEKLKRLKNDVTLSVFHSEIYHANLKKNLSSFVLQQCTPTLLYQLDFALFMVY